MNRIVDPEGMPPAVGFSHATESTGERVLWVAGQTGHRPDGSIEADMVEQFRQALANVAACLGEAGYPPSSLVRMVIYTTDMAEYRRNLEPIGEAYRDVFGRHYPAMALLGVSELFDPAATVEVVSTAVV